MYMRLNDQSYPMTNLNYPYMQSCYATTRCMTIKYNCNNTRLIVIG